ncbi:hypothetical protein [Haloarchaeobius sp. TZWWS8]|uniref:hypothetical protein n=1 Tax=Haloarchaeobius sp. TZWWS8 TaxID=3446121 RepID=UPI003EBA4CDF
MLETTARAEGVTVRVAESTFSGDLDESGSATWTATVILDEGASALADDATRRNRIVRTIYASDETVFDDPRNLSTTVTGDTLTVRFDTPAVADHGPADVLVFDAFARGPGLGIVVDADRMTLSGPADAVVTHASGSTSTDGNSTRWSTTGAGAYIDSAATVIFAPDPGPVGGIATVLALRLTALTLLWPTLARFAGVPSVILGVSATGLLFVGGHLAKNHRFGRDRVAFLGTTTLALLSAVWFSFAFLDGGRILGVGVPVLELLPVLASGLVGQSALAVVGLAVYRRLVGGAATGLSILSLTCWLVLVSAVALGPDSLQTTAAVYVATPMAAYWFGQLSARSNPLRFLFPVFVSIAPFALAFPFVVGDGFSFVTPPMLVAWAVGSAALGAPLYVAGVRISEASRRFREAGPELPY